MPLEMIQEIRVRAADFSAAVGSLHHHLSAIAESACESGFGSESSRMMGESQGPCAHRKWHGAIPSAGDVAGGSFVFRASLPFTCTRTSEPWEGALGRVVWRRLARLACANAGPHAKRPRQAKKAWAVRIPLARGV